MDLLSQHGQERENYGCNDAQKEGWALQIKTGPV
jgi:hypothetical protein